MYSILYTREFSEMSTKKLVSTRPRRRKIRDPSSLSEPVFPMLDDTDIRYIETRVHYLRMNYRPNFGAETESLIDIQELSKPIDTQYYLELYQTVGLSCNWVDRLVISDDELHDLINGDNINIFIIFYEDDPCGFVEFEREPGYVEMLYFGLFPEFIGKGIGAFCLRKAVETAWSYGPEWIQLNTCELDSDRALELYLNAGFELYTTRMETRRRFQ
jgi:GNAT superfamily N-acetyltransferase